MLWYRYDTRVWAAWLSWMIPVFTLTAGEMLDD